MNLQINTTQIAYPKSCLNANIGNLQPAKQSSLKSLAKQYGCESVVNSVKGLFALISHSMEHGYVTLDFLPLAKWIQDDWQEGDILSISIKMKVSGSDRELQYILDDCEDILHASLTGTGPYAKEVLNA